MKKLYLTLAVLFLAGTVTGFSADTNLANADYSKQHINQHLEQAEIPSFLSSLVGGQTVNLYLSAGEQQRTIGIEMNGMKVEEVEQGGYEEPTLKVWVNQEDIEKLNEASQPVQKLDSMLKQEEIRYRSYGTVNKVKFSVASIALDVASALGF